MKTRLTIFASKYQGSELASREIDRPDVPAMTEDPAARDAVRALFAEHPTGALVTETIVSLGEAGLDYWPEPGTVIGTWASGAEDGAGPEEFTPETVSYSVKFTAPTDGNWCAVAGSQKYDTLEAARAAIAADETCGPDPYGNVPHVWIEDGEGAAHNPTAELAVE